MMLDNITLSLVASYLILFTFLHSLLHTLTAREIIIDT